MTSATATQPLDGHGGGPGFEFSAKRFSILKTVTATKRPPSLRQRQKTQTHEHLLRVATDLFAEKGFAATSVEEVVVHAGASRATFYSHFANKDAILAEILEGLWNDAQRHYDEFGLLEDWSKASLLDWVASFADDWKEKVKQNRLISSEGSNLAHADVPKWKRRHAESMRANSELWLTRFTEKEAELRSIALVDLIQGMLMDYHFERIRISSDDFSNNLMEMIRDVLRETDRRT